MSDIKPRVVINDTDVVNGTRRIGTKIGVVISVSHDDRGTSSDIHHAILDKTERFRDRVEIHEAYDVGILENIFVLSTTSKVDITIIPYDVILHTTIRDVVLEAVNQFGDLVDAESG